MCLVPKFFPGGGDGLSSQWGWKFNCGDIAHFIPLSSHHWGLGIQKNTCRLKGPKDFLAANISEILNTHSDEKQNLNP